MSTAAEEDEWTVGLVAVAEVMVVDVSVVAVSDLVEDLQPLKARPARRSVNKIEFFIGGLSCPQTDLPRTAEFRPQRECFLPRRTTRNSRACECRSSNGFARYMGSTKDLH